MAGRRPAWVRWAVCLWLTCQVVGVAALAAPVPADCGCTLVSCPMHHQHGRAADGAKCHLFDPHQPAATAVAALLGPVGPAASVITLVRPEATSGRDAVFAVGPLDRLSTPITPPPRG